MKLWPRVVGLILAGGLFVSAGAAWATDDDRMSAHPTSASTKQVPPKQWAHDLCTALKDWKSNISDARDTNRTAVTTASNLSDAKNAMVTFMATVVQETDTMLDQLSDAGVPKIKDGTKVARAIESGITDIRNIFAGAQEKANSLSTTDPAQFQAVATEISDTMSTGGVQFQQNITRAQRKYKAASRALNDPACKTS